MTLPFRDLKPLPNRGPFQFVCRDSNGITCGAGHRTMAAAQRCSDRKNAHLRALGFDKRHFGQPGIRWTVECIFQ